MLNHYGMRGVIALRIDVMGVGFDNLTKSEFAARAEEMLLRREGGYCVTPNAEILYEAARSPDLRSVLCNAALVLPDGAGVVLGSKLLGTPLREKVAGIEFGEEVCRLLAKHGKRLYLLGSKPGIAHAAGEKLAAKYPGLLVCGSADGYFTDEAAAVAAIREARPDAVFVCLGAPKQERFMADHCRELPGTLLLGLGGSLDGYAGLVRRAPQIMIDGNLEWLYRLCKDPKRIGRMMRLPKFVGICVAEKARRLRHG